MTMEYTEGHCNPHCVWGIASDIKSIAKVCEGTRDE